MHETDAGSIPPQAWVGTAEPTASALDPIQNRDEPIPKPSGGLWTSTYDADEQTCAWLDWMHGAQWGFEPGMGLWRLEVDPSAECFVIDALDELHQLIRVASLPEDEQYLPTNAFPDLDFEYMAEQNSGYDGIHLTEQGQAHTRLSVPSLSGWDCESILWFDWQFTDVSYVRDVHPPDD